MSSSHVQRRRVQQQSSAFPTRQLFVLGTPRYFHYLYIQMTNNIQRCAVYASQLPSCQSSLMFIT